MQITVKLEREKYKTTVVPNNLCGEGNVCDEQAAEANLRYF